MLSKECDEVSGNVRYYVEESIYEIRNTQYENHILVINKLKSRDIEHKNMIDKNAINLKTRIRNNN